MALPPLVVTLKGKNDLDEVLASAQEAILETGESIQKIGETAIATTNAVKKVSEGLASAWTPGIAAANRAASASKAAWQAAQEEARKAKDAVTQASKEQKAAAQADLAVKQEVTRAAAQAYHDSTETIKFEQKAAFSQITEAARVAGEKQKQIARDVANAEKKAAREAADAQAQAIQKGVEAAKRASQSKTDLLAQAVTAQGVQQVGSVVKGAGNAGVGFVDNSTNLFKEQETTLKTIEAVTGSAERANAVFAEMDKRSTTSVFNLSELNTGAKVLENAKLKTEEWIAVADDLAAGNKEANATPVDTATVLRRIKSGDTGEGVERLADYGISKLDLQAKGIAFDGGGAVEDKSEEGLNRLLQAVKELTQQKYGGLSQKLATETFEGVESNEQDAKERVLREVGAGAAAAQTQVDGLNSSLFKTLGVFPGISRGAGVFAYLGGHLLWATGSAISFAGSLAQAFLGYTAWINKRNESAVAAGKEAIAVTAAGTASATAGGEAVAGAAGFKALEKAENDATKASGKETIAVAGAGTASATAGGEAAAGAVGFETLAKAENDAAAAAVKETGAVATAGTASATAGVAAGAGGAATAAGSAAGGAAAGAGAATGAGAAAAGGAGAGATGGAAAGGGGAAGGVLLPAALAALSVFGFHQAWTGVADRERSDADFENRHIFGRVINPLSHFFGRNPFARGAGDSAEAKSNKILNDMLANHGKKGVKVYDGDEVDETSPTAAEIAQAQAKAQAAATAKRQEESAKAAVTPPLPPASLAAYSITPGVNAQLSAQINTMLSGGAPSALGGLGSEDAYESRIEALQDEQAASKKGFDPNSVANRLRLTRRGLSHQKKAKAQQKALERQAKTEQREAEKLHKIYTRDADAQHDTLADIQLAALEADTELRIKQMEAEGASARDIAEAKADAILREAKIRASGLKSSDKYGADKLLRLAQIKAQHTIDMSQFDDGGSKGGKQENARKEAEALARLRAGLSIGGGAFGEPSSSGGGVFSPYAGSALHQIDLRPSQPSGSSSPSSSSTGRNGGRQVTLNPRAQVDGQILTIRTPDIRIPLDSNYESDLNGLPNL